MFPISKVKPRVTEQMNEALTAVYTREEVKKALFNIGDKPRGRTDYTLFSLKSFGG